jgi:hypothetical protein
MLISVLHIVQSTVSRSITREDAVPNDLTARTRIPGPDDADHDDGLLMHELTVLNNMIGRYVLRFLDVDAGRAKPIATSDERALGSRLASAGAAIQARADRRDHDDRP